MMRFGFVIAVLSGFLTTSYFGCAQGLHNPSTSTSSISGSGSGSNTSSSTSSSSSSQTPDSISVYHPGHSQRIGPVIGYRGFKNSFGEIGLTVVGIGHGVEGFEISYLNNFESDSLNISGFSLGYLKGFAIFEIGVNGTVYTDFDAARLYVRPFAGFGIGGIATISYGYNIPFGPNIFKDQISPHEFRMIVRIPIADVYRF